MKKIAVTRILSIILFLAVSFSLVSCFEDDQNKEKEGKVKELTQKTDAAQLKLGKLLTNPEGIDQKAVEDTLKTINETSKALADLKDSGGSWYDIGKGALGGVFGRTLLHAVRAALVAFLPTSGGGVIASLLGLALGGSGTGDKKRAT